MMCTDRLQKKQAIYQAINEMEAANEKSISELKKQCFLTDYKEDAFVDESGISIWSFAFQRALAENEIIIIPNDEQPYYIDRSIVIPSNRWIKADKDAVIRQKEGVKVLMFRNTETADGTHQPIDSGNPNRNIMISGGKWEESRDRRSGYGCSGMYDETRSFFGVSTCMLFNHIEGLTMKDLVFVHTAGFAVQCGDIKNAVFENIRFERCFADGIHINGNTENVVVRNVSGQVGDDLVALNMFDWQNSSVNFGPAKNILCENLVLSPDSPCKAVRIQPGMYYYDNGEAIDCSIDNLIVSNVKGIKTFKLYFQTPAHPVNELPERGGVGSCGDLFFDHIDILLDGPIDGLPEYINSDRIKGSFGGFEIGANMHSITLENIRVIVDKQRFPMAFLCCIGPKSSIVANGAVEVFNPEVSCTLEELIIKDITINGTKPDNMEPYIHAIDFTPWGGRGSFGKITYQKETICVSMR